MPKYLLEVNYSGAGVKGLLKDGGSGRKAVAEKLTTSLGGTMEAFYYAFGDTDLYVIVDMPDNVSAAAASLVVNAGETATTRCTVLLSAGEMDEATRKTPAYSPPKG